MRGGASAVVALALPHYLTRALDHDRFAAWALMLQIAAFAGYLDFGLQTAVARYLAQAMERGDDEQRDSLVSTAFAMLAGGGALALLVIGAVAWQLPRIFHGAPPQMIGELRGGVLVLAASAALLLPMSTFTGVLIGLHRNEYPALAIGGSRILGAVAVLLAVRHTHSLVWLAVCIGGFNLVGGLVQPVIVMYLLPALRLHVERITRGMVIELLHYCGALSVWSFAMLLITGLDVTIVGHFDFEATGAYAIAATLITFYTGVTGSIFSAMMTPVAVLQARGETGRIRELILDSTQLNSYASLICTAATFLVGPWMLRAWVGPVYAAGALPILELLVVAQSARMVGLPFSTVLVAMGLQRYAVPNAIIEGCLNLALSLVGAALVGAEGVAWATLVASIAAVALLVWRVMGSVRELGLSRAMFVRKVVLMPVLVFLPVLAWVAMRAAGVAVAAPLHMVLPVVSCLATMLLLMAAVFRMRRMRQRRLAG